MVNDIDRARIFVADDSLRLATGIIDSNPWLCDQVGVQLDVWALPLLARHGLTAATLHLVGSAAVGFSLKAEQPGRPFRRIGGGARPSDLDVAIVCAPLFDDCWSEMANFDRQTRWTSDPQDRQAVYWGHIDHQHLPDRAQGRRKLQTIANEIRKSVAFRDYPCTIRVYRKRSDLMGYVRHSIFVLERSIRP